MLKIAGNYPQGLRVSKMVNDSNSKSSFTWDNNLWRLYERGGEIHFLVKGKSANVKNSQGPREFRIMNDSKFLISYFGQHCQK